MNRHGNQARPSHKIKFDAIFVEDVAQTRQHKTLNGMVDFHLLKENVRGH